MELHTILVISQSNTDHLVLSSCIERAQPPRFRVASSINTEHPLDALSDPGVQAIVLAHGAESDYLLRLASKNRVTAPIIMLLDEPNELLISQLRDLGAQDYLVRGQLQDAVVHRIFDYGIELKQARDEIKRLSNRDSLTGALNRISFRSHLEQVMAHSERHGARAALLYINIDHFSHINDHYGEHHGDVMIREVSQRLSNKLRSTDRIARLGGDEFAVVLEDAGSDSEIESIAQKMLASVSNPMILSEHQVSATASIGAAIYPQDGQQFPDLVDRARCAMQQAKTVKGNKVILYCEQLSFDESGSTSLAAELRAAARNNQFELHYQPRMDLGSGQLVALEALLRWNHPERGLISPGEFLSTCEDMGLLKTIGYQVIQHACSALTWLKKHKLAHVDVAVNIAFSQIQDEHFVEVVREIIQQNNIDPRQLEFELTESTILKNPEAIKARIEALQDLGITFSLDDFGTGFSQLSHLSELPITALKIDAGFVSELPHNPHQEAICNMIIEMAQRLGIDVVAEGAETYEQVEFLRKSNCQQVQGYYYSQAMPLQQLPGFIEKQHFSQRRAIIS